MSQVKQDSWSFQWREFHDDSLFLFKEWLYPNTLEMFKGKEVVDCGCGGGQHARFVAPYAKSVLAIDLNTTDLAKEYAVHFPNISFKAGDLAEVQLNRQYDIVYCIGVIQHTSVPDATFKNIKKFVKPGGRLILWCYSKEGNWPNWLLLESLKRLFLLRLPKRFLVWLSVLLTALIHPLVFSLYILPLTFLPYYQYFGNWRKLSFRRNQLNVFDKLNAPITNFITRAQVGDWFNSSEFKDIFIDHYKQVSWRASATKF